jgi:hypothetical protein
MGDARHVFPPWLFLRCKRRLIVGFSRWPAFGKLCSCWIKCWPTIFHGQIFVNHLLDDGSSFACNLFEIEVIESKITLIEIPYPILSVVTGKQSVAWHTLPL